MDSRRVRPLNDARPAAGPVVYWMQRDQRARDNWALLHAQRLALDLRSPLAVVFCLVPAFLGATMRQYRFMLGGLRETEASLREKGIPFFLLAGNPPDEIPAFLARRRAGALVVDFNPLRIAAEWRREVAARAAVPVVEVDAHNIVPCRVASEKAEVGARTFRPKIARLLPSFLTDIPALAPHPFPWSGAVEAPDWRSAERRIRADRGVPEVGWIRPGERAAARALREFASERLPLYEERRNDPAEEWTSRLSPYLHFGQISAQRVALEAKRSPARKGSREAFLEELVVRRELADNFCRYTEHYDGVDGFPAWARKSLDRHAGDRRPFLYTFERLERGGTHDEIWNAAQREMVARGFMHGYMRMYWGKKLLEWTASPAEALEIAIRLNDRYELDGRDPNGYAGIAWCIGGVHDRPWPERPVFGIIRSMSAGGCRSKFSVGAYIRMVDGRRGGG
ncbi:MAG: deoxyribodipyrimidine photo-lyase [bacterium]|nr:deoxyribodipyrimidine photo-lyase [bacterium]